MYKCVYMYVYMCAYICKYIYYIYLQDIFYIIIYVYMSFLFVARILGILIFLATKYHMIASEIQYNSFPPLEKI